MATGGGMMAAPMQMTCNRYATTADATRSVRARDGKGPCCMRMLSMHQRAVPDHAPVGADHDSRELQFMSMTMCCSTECSGAVWYTAPNGDACNARLPRCENQWKCISLTLQCNPRRVCAKRTCFGHEKRGLSLGEGSPRFMLQVKSSIFKA